MNKYLYVCKISGYIDGEVLAENVEEAKENAKYDAIEITGIGGMCSVEVIEIEKRGIENADD